MKYLVFIVVLLLELSVHAQHVTKATSQGWAAGVCCATGTNYVVTLEMDHPPLTIEIVDVHLAGHGRLHASLMNPTGKIDATLFTVHFGVSENPYEEIRRLDIGIDKEYEPPYPMYEGVALVPLIVNGETIRLTVSEFEELPYIPYP